MTFHYRIFVVFVFDKISKDMLKRKSWGNIFNDYIFEISRFHWSKCTVECAIYSILILKSAQARCEKSDIHTVGIFVATMIEKFFVDSDNGLCIQKNRQIQWNKGFLIWTMAFWEKRDLVIMKKFWFPCTFLMSRTWQQAWIYLKIMWKVPRFEFKPCDDSYCFEIIQSNTRLVSYLWL